MKKIAVESKIIESVFFSQEDGQLYIAFKNGETRQFSGVSEEAVVDMASAKSPGHHYIENIRTKFRRVA